MELNVIRKETIGQGENGTTVVQDIASFEIMDGCPVNES